MVRKKSETDKPKVSGGGGCKRRAPKPQYYLVCTTNLNSDVLFTVPLSIMKPFDWDRWVYIRLFRTMTRVLAGQDTVPGNFDMFRYAPASGTFAVDVQVKSAIPAYFLDGMPWINTLVEPPKLASFLTRSLGVPASTIDRDKIEREAHRVGSMVLKIPAFRP